MSESSIREEIQKLIGDKLMNGKTVQVDWITNEIVSGHDQIDGEDLPFYRVCAYRHVHREVKRAVGKYDARPETDRHAVLPGFEHLQCGYPVERDGVRVLVPTDMLSDEELEARAAEYVAMASGCLAHADEIRKFLRMRKAGAAA